MKTFKIPQEIRESTEANISIQKENTASSDSKDERETSNPTNPTNPMDTFCSEFSASPLYHEKMYRDLPELLQKVCEPFKGRDRDLSLIGSMTVLSACMPNIYGYYDNSLVYPNLYLFVSAPASAGKGILNHCGNLAMPIHDRIFSENKALEEEYNKKILQYRTDSRKNPLIPVPQKPGKRMLFIPANNSASGVFQLLNANEGKGLIFETEGDTLSNTFKKDYGNFSDNFRKAFQHETLRYYRKTDSEYAEIKKPRLSTVLSGTPHQILSLIPNSEDGLLSRFIFYVFDLVPVWKNVFNKDLPKSLSDYFLEIGNEYFKLYETLSSTKNTEFEITDEQIKIHEEFFSKNQKRIYYLWGSEPTASVNRLGMIVFRIAMILTVLRAKGTEEKLICNEVDFNISMHIVEILLEHAVLVYQFVNKGASKGMSIKDRFYNNLPQEFDRTKYLEVAGELSIPDKTAQKYIAEFIKNMQLFRAGKNKYQKV